MYFYYIHMYTYVLLFSPTRQNLSFETVLRVLSLKPHVVNNMLKTFYPSLPRKKHRLCCCVILAWA